MKSELDFAKLPPFDKHSGQLKAQWVYTVLRDAIITMKLKPGATINEKEISAELGISRTPMREALLRLGQEGLVEIIPSGGTFVNNISLRRVIEGHIIRSSLELRMVHLAARFYSPQFEKDFDLLAYLQGDAKKRADYDQAYATDNDFHQLLCKVAGFPDVWQVIQNYTGQLDRVRRLAFPVSGHFDEVAQEHADIYAALKMGDETRAHGLLRDHLNDITQVLDAVVASEPDFFSEEVSEEMLSALQSPPEG